MSAVLRVKSGCVVNAKITRINIVDAGNGSVHLFVESTLNILHIFLYGHSSNLADPVGYRIDVSKENRRSFRGTPSLSGPGYEYPIEYSLLNECVAKVTLKYTLVLQSRLEKTQTSLFHTQWCKNPTNKLFGNQQNVLSFRLIRIKITPIDTALANR